MKNYRNLIAVPTLALVLLTSAHAGDGIMHTGVAAPTPTPPPPVSGVMHTGMTAEAAPTAGAESETAADIVTVVALDLLRSVLTLF